MAHDPDLASSVEPAPVEGVIDPREAMPFVAPHVHRTPLLSSRLLDRASGLEVRLKAECFQRTGSYKIRGPLFKLARLSPEEQARGVVCSSAGNHAQGVALAASIFGINATVVMAQNATPSKVQATRAYGAEVVQHGAIWDEADAHARELSTANGLTFVAPFDDYDLIAGQGTLGVEIYEDFPDVDVVVVPIGGGGLISGVATAIKLMNPTVRIIGVESAGAPGMQLSKREGRLVTLDDVKTPIDGLRVRRVGSRNLRIVRQYVDDIVTVPDEQTFDALVWLMTHCKLVVEGAAAATVAALLNHVIDLPASSRVVAVLSGGNLDVSRLAGMSWN
jgi:threonine dehydratase